MRSILVLVALVAVVAFAAPDYSVMFKNFKQQYGRTYPSLQEEATRFGIFVENMKKAAKFQKTNPKATFGINEFADVSAAEFKIRHNLKASAARKAVAPLFGKDEVKAAATKIDWRALGAVTGIKNQGQCGSCWAFSTTGSIEGQWFLAGNPLTSLSEQELTSCDTVDLGCNGGLPDDAMGWLLSAHNGSIVTEASYPYVSGGGAVPSCNMANTVVGATITGHQDLPKDEGQMATWLYTNGPISILVDATSFQTYTGGILTDCVSVQIDHAVLAVGYDDTNNPPYWIVKNSWGTSWGENGYIRLQKGTDQCLITYGPATAIVPKAGPPPPSPPSPSGIIIQKSCTDPDCKSCTDLSIPQGTCVASGSSSFIATCITDGLLIQTFESSSMCTGNSHTTVDPINVCSLVFNPTTSSYVMNTCHGSGPTPPTTPPTPPSPPNPTPAPTNGTTFTQKMCQDPACSQGCQSNSFPQNVCLGLNGGGSAMAVCQPGQLLLTEYPTSSNCQGASTADAMPINQCLQDAGGSYLENICPGQSAAATGVVTAGKAVHITKRSAAILRKIIAARRK